MKITHLNMNSQVQLYMKTRDSGFLFSISSFIFFEPTLFDNLPHDVYIVKLVIFVCLHFRKFLILGLFTKFRTREFSFSISSAIMIMIFARFLHLRICLPSEIREN